VILKRVFEDSDLYWTQSINPYNKSHPDYKRNTILNVRGKRLENIRKRPYTNHCEVCGRPLGVGEGSRDLSLISKNRGNYHHWNDEHPEKGIWVCQWCHWGIEAIDHGFNHRDKYLNLKEAIEVGRL
jgi:hypothetical protein